MTDSLYATKQITSSIADNSKFQYDEFLKIAIQKHDEFLSFDFHKDRL